MRLCLVEMPELLWKELTFYKSQNSATHTYEQI